MVYAAVASSFKDSSFLKETFTGKSAGLLFTLEQMNFKDIPKLMALFESTAGVSFKDWENEKLLRRAIERNPGFNLVARATDGQLLAASFAGDTGLRGSFHHVTVREGFRQEGIGSAIVNQTLQKFKEIGILRIINIVEDSNQGGIDFWLKKGFRISTARGGVTVQMTRDLQPLDDR